MLNPGQQHICQVAFSALNGPALRDWYADVFGLLKAGKMLFAPPSTTRVQGIPGAWETCGWLVDQQDYFQLEFFQFLFPRSKLKAVAWRPCDIGYNMLGITVSNFDQVLRNFAALSAREAPRPTGDRGNRRVCVTDPEGNWVEIYESDPLALIEGTNQTVVRPEVGAVVRSMRVSVPDLAVARQSFTVAMGLSEVEGYQLHSDEDEARWGLPGATARRLVLRSGNFLLELVEYASPQPQPWPQDYSIADQGFMNIALGYRNREDYDSAFAHATSNGMRANGKLLDAGIFRVMYVNDPAGFSVEMLYARKPLWSISGFNVREPGMALELDIKAPPETVWRALSDHGSMGRWSVFRCEVVREGKVDPDGVGCIRELRAGGLRIREEITDWEAGRHFSYRVLSGAPFARHRGDVFVTPTAGGSRVRWAVRFRSRIPFTGHLTGWVLGRVFARGLRRLKHQLET